MIKAIIFDCFGVMQLGPHRVLEEKFPDIAGQLDDLTRQADYGFISSAEYTAALMKLTNTSQDEVISIIASGHTFNQPLADYITSHLKKQYKIGLLSNVGRGWLQNFFDTHQLHELFNEVVSSGDEGVVKPHPQMYELIAERLGLEPEECLMVDDLPENIAGADAAGMRGIVYGNLRDFVHDINKIIKEK